MRRITRERIKAQARQVLHQVRVSHPPVPIETIVASMNISVHYEPFEGDLSGAIIRSDDLVVIGVNSLHHPNRQRFTIGHELGHFLLHVGKDLHIDRGYRFNLRSSSGLRDSEIEDWQANVFAAEILMPEQFLRKDLAGKPIDGLDERGIKKLADRYGVSPQAMTIRLNHLHLI